jgi:hypothetical protein
VTVTRCSVLSLTLSATKPLPVDLRKGPNSQVDDAIINDGLIKKPVGAVLLVVATANSMKKMIRDKSPEELEDINEEKLKVISHNKLIKQ